MNCGKFRTCISSTVRFLPVKFIRQPGARNTTTSASGTNRSNSLSVVFVLLPKEVTKVVFFSKGFFLKEQNKILKKTRNMIMENYILMRNRDKIFFILINSHNYRLRKLHEFILHVHLHNFTIHILDHLTKCTLICK